MHALFRGLQRSSQVALGARGLAGIATAAEAAAKPAVAKEFLVYRWNPDSGEPPKYDSYKIDINA